MVALKAAQIDGFMARPGAAPSIVLVFGPDAGLVRERAEKLIHASVDDPNDPFSLARLEGDELAANPTNLVEEANTIPLFGGRRAVWVRAGSRNFLPAVEALAAAASPDCRVVIEAGDLKKSAPLRSFCERAPNIAALPCYADAEKELARLIDDEMRVAGLTITPEARTLLTSLLGGDRLASRSEVRKLALYAHGQERIDVDDVIAVVADASMLALDGLIDAAFAGRTNDVEFQFAKARTAGTTPASIIAAAQRHLITLHKARVAIDQGQSASSVVQGLFLHFRRAPRVEAALKTWSTTRLERLMGQFAETTLEARKRAELAEPLAHRALLAVAVNARRRD
jgi:DNA polymerase III subunit delta